MVSPSAIARKLQLLHLRSRSALLIIMEPIIGLMLLRRMPINIAPVVLEDIFLRALQVTHMVASILILARLVLYAIPITKNMLNILMQHLVFVKLQII